MKSKVEYINHYGDDAKVCEVARVSTQSKQKGVKELINFLIRNEHLSPFEFCFIEYQITMPIFIARQFMRHRTFKYAEKSMRYYKGNGEDIEFYHFDEPIDYWFDEYSYNEQDDVTLYEHSVNSISLETYQQHIEKGVPSEKARSVLTQSMMTTVRVQCDLRNLLSFFKQRLDKNAQTEIRDVAIQMYEIFHKFFPITSQAFKDYILYSIKLSTKEQRLLVELIKNKFHNTNKVSDFEMSENEYEQALTKFKFVEVI